MPTIFQKPNMLLQREFTKNYHDGIGSSFRNLKTDLPMQFSGLFSLTAQELNRALSCPDIMSFSLSW
jgi:hypothetical protein